MKSYRTLALKELLSQKVTSILILIAVVLSTMMTTIVAVSYTHLDVYKRQTYPNGNLAIKLYEKDHGILIFWETLTTCLLYTSKVLYYRYYNFDLDQPFQPQYEQNNRHLLADLHRIVREQ